MRSIETHFLSYKPRIFIQLDELTRRKQSPVHLWRGTRASMRRAAFRRAALEPQNDEA